VNKNLTIRKYEEKNLKEEITQAILDLLVFPDVLKTDLPKELNRK